MEEGNKVYITVTEFKSNIKMYMGLAEFRPIFITKYGKPTFVLMSVNHYDMLTGTCTSLEGK